jgi:hypothetical protein
MEFLKQGTRVIILGTEIKATVAGVSRRGDLIEYDIVWWANGERKTEWVFSFEIEAYNDNSKPAGFKNYDNKQTLIE